MQLAIAGPLPKQFHNASGAIAKGPPAATGNPKAIPMEPPPAIGHPRGIH